MPQENSAEIVELETRLARYRRLIDQALDSMTIENIRELVREIEEELARKRQ
jgi:hypothetical protein